MPPRQVAWLAAHLTWLRIGQDNAAYGAFGHLGQVIDGTTAGLIEGRVSPKFTGFHKIELDLWGGSDIGAAAGDTARLSAAVARLTSQPLSHWLPRTVTSEAGWILRSHEVMEDAIRDSLSGHDDYGSGSDLRSVIADTQATNEDLDLLAPLLRPRSPHLLARCRRSLHHLVAVVRSTEENGSFISVSELSRLERERVNAAVGDAVETLAPVPDLLPLGGAT